MAVLGPVWRRRLRRTFGGLALVLTLFAIVVLVDGWTALGKAPEGARHERMQRSPQYGDGVFVNPQPLWNDSWGMLSEGLFGPSHQTTPSEPLPVQQVDPRMFDTPPDSGLRVTWLGHSTSVLEVEGHTFLLDPVWGPRTSPVTWLGPARWYAPLLALEDLPQLDAVVISHDHYDHLDFPTIAALAARDTKFIAPLGVGAHLEYWGVPAAHIVEVDWWDEIEFDGLTVVAVPARHASGRQVFDQNRTLWAGYAFVGERRRVLFTGDTGLFPGMTEIGNRFGPFDLTMIEVGAYGRSWPDWHLGPEQAVRAHTMLQGKVMLPIHWGLFNLAMHGWTEPMERVLVEADKRGVTVVAPHPGESIDPTDAPPVQRWWPEVAWRGVDEYPIVATLVD